jgi:peptidyl-prolyl cis-trans isomerase C
MIRSRAFLLSLALLSLVLGLWGCAGSSGGKAPKGGPEAGSAAPSSEGPVLARVAGHAITRHQVDSVLATAPPSIRGDYLTDPEMFQQLVERIAQQDMLYLAALKDGVDRDPAYLSEVEAQKRTILMKRYYQKTVQALPPISEDAVRQYYDAHPAEFGMPARARVRHILVRTQAKAREVLRQLRTSSWEKVCPRYSTDKVTAKSGGILGFVTNDGGQVPGVGTAPAIVAAAFKLKEGETSEPLKSPLGWHIIRVEEKTEAGPQPFVNVQQQIRGTMEGGRSEQFQQTLLDSLKKVYNVVIYTDAIKEAMEPVLTPSQLFLKAQAVPSARERIDVFRQVVTKYPEDKSAIQASFMIGFTYAEELKDYPAARAAFQEFIRKYPSSDLVASANWMLENMEHSAPPPSVGLPDSLRFEMVPAPAKGPATKP